jgi:hypothetical protein
MTADPITAVSFAQERRIRLATAAEPTGPAAKTVPVLCRLPAPVDVDALSHAVRQMVLRHRSLLHRFVDVDDEVTLEWAGAGVADLDCDVVAESELPASDGSSDAALAYVRGQVDRPFDVLGWPLFRFGVVTGDRPLFYLIFDHLVADGGSALLAIREVEQLYLALMRGRVVDLPKAGDFLRYAQAQRRRCGSGPAVDGQAEALRRHLGGRMVHPSVPIETDWDLTRPRYADVDLLDAGETARLDDLCRDSRVTPFMAVLAAFGVAVRELTDHDEAGVLIATDNREHPEARAGVGWFANMVPLYFPTARTDRLGTAARTVRDQLMRMLPYHEFPLARMLDTVPGSAATRHDCFMSFVDARADERHWRWRQLDFAPSFRSGYGMWVVRRDGGLGAFVASPAPAAGTGTLVKFETRIATELRAAVAG